MNVQITLLFALAVCFLFLGKRLKLIDEVYALAAYGAGTISALWTFIMAPTTAQIFLEVMILGWTQVAFRRV